MQAHGYTVVALHLRSIPKGIESKEQYVLPSTLGERSKDTTLYSWDGDGKDPAESGQSWEQTLG
jgi:hypothetical protein